MLTHNKRFFWLLSTFLALTLLLAACGNDEEPAAAVVEGGATPTEVTTDEEVASNVLTETEALAAETGVTDTANISGEGLTSQDVTIITGTQLVTGTQITTDVIVSTETTVLEQQLITTVITATDVVTDVTTLTDEETTSDTEFITDTTGITPEAVEGAAVAEVDVTQLTPTPTPTIVVELTRVVTATETVTDTVPVSVTATPRPRTPTPTPTVVVQVTRVVTDTTLVTDTRIITAVATPRAGAAPQTGAVQTSTVTGMLIFIGIAGADDNLVRASTLLDYDFENIDGEVSGEIEDLIIDTRTGQILFATLEYGGFLDIGDTELPAPLSAFTWGPSGRLVLNIAGDRLQEFPDLGADWPDVSSPNWGDQALAFWRDNGIETDFTADQPTNTIVRVSDLIGTGIGSSNYTVSDIGYGDGVVEDMLVAPGEGRAKYLLISYDDAFANEWLLLPFSAFDATAFGDQFVLSQDFDSSLLETAPRVAADQMGQAGVLNSTFDDDVDTYWQDAGYPLNGTE